MGLFHKVRILMGALVHKPFMPRPEKVALDEAGDEPAAPAAGPDHKLAEEGQAEVADTGRVADLIARQQRGEE
jgi:hypothetical protein